MQLKSNITLMRLRIMREVKETKKILKFDELSKNFQDKIIDRHRKFLLENLDTHKVLKGYYEALENDFAFKEIEINFFKGNIEKGLFFNFSVFYNFENAEELFTFFHSIKFCYDKYPDFLNHFDNQNIDLEIYNFRNSAGFENLDLNLSQIEIAITDNSGYWDEKSANQFRKELKETLKIWYTNLCDSIHNDVSIFLHETTHYTNIYNKIKMNNIEFYEDGTIYISE